jgi:hypothetical protein
LLNPGSFTPKALFPFGIARLRVRAVCSQPLRQLPVCLRIKLVFLTIPSRLSLAHYHPQARSRRILSRHVRRFVPCSYTSALLLVGCQLDTEKWRKLAQKTSTESRDFSVCPDDRVRLRGRHKIRRVQLRCPQLVLRKRNRKQSRMPRRLKLEPAKLRKLYRRRRRTRLPASSACPYRTTTTLE